MPGQQAPTLSTSPITVRWVFTTVVDDDDCFSWQINVDVRGVAKGHFSKLITPQAQGRDAIPTLYRSNPMPSFVIVLYAASRWLQCWHGGIKKFYVIELRLCTTKYSQRVSAWKTLRKRKTIVPLKMAQSATPITPRNRKDVQQFSTNLTSPRRRTMNPFPGIWLHVVCDVRFRSETPITSSHRIMFFRIPEMTTRWLFSFRRQIVVLYTISSLSSGSTTSVALGAGWGSAMGGGIVSRFHHQFYLN